jgi:hypothetical protein
MQHVRDDLLLRRQVGSPAASGVAMAVRRLSRSPILRRYADCLIDRVVRAELDAVRNGPDRQPES